MPGLVIEVDSERVQRLLQRLDKTCSEGFADTMKEIGEDLVYSTRQRFIRGVAPDGTAWKTPLSDATLAMRVRRGRNGQKPLIDTGTLKGSVDYEPQPDGLLLFANRQYKSKKGNKATAAVHQFGTGRAGAKHNITIAARPFLGLSDDDVDKIERTIARALEDEVNNG